MIVAATHRRLDDLERHFSKSRGCPYCGRVADDPRASYEIVWDDSEEGTGAPEHCENCGQPVVIIVRWDDPE